MFDKLTAHIGFVVGLCLCLNLTPTCAASYAGNAESPLASITGTDAAVTAPVCAVQQFFAGCVSVSYVADLIIPPCTTGGWRNQRGRLPLELFSGLITTRYV